MATLTKTPEITLSKDEFAELRKNSMVRIVRHNQVIPISSNALSLPLEMIADGKKANFRCMKVSVEQ